MSGKSELKSITLDPESENKDEIEMLKDLIKKEIADSLLGL